MSDNFPNIPGAKNDPSYSSDNFESIASPSLPGSRMADPGNTGAMSNGMGMVKKATDMSGPSGMPSMTGDVQNKGKETDYTPTPGMSGFNIDGNVSPMTFGNPLNADDGFHSVNEPARHGF